MTDPVVLAALVGAILSAALMWFSDRRMTKSVDKKWADEKRWYCWLKWEAQQKKLAEAEDWWT